jgi:DNA-3-methyladenine glycosylase
VAHPLDKIAGSMAEEIHADDEQGSIDDTRYQDPFPQFMFLYKPVGLEISLYANNHFFQQNEGFMGDEVNTFRNFKRMKAITFKASDKLPVSFYRQKNVCTIAKALIGKVLVSSFNRIITAGRIVETEAYNGAIDRASHAWGGRRTNRTEIMYANGGLAYVYLCYGIHHLFNVVTNVADVPHAVLIRGIEPLVGINHMLQRTGKIKLDHTLTRGPGNVSKALGIYTQHTGIDLRGNELFIVDDGFIAKPSSIAATPRIGVDYAGMDALLPYRFILKDNPYVSGKKIK